jgi:alpha-galactosidase
MAKVAVIGAGSIVFASRLIADILSYEHLRDTQFALVDVDAERLEFAKRITDRIIGEGGYTGAGYVASTERRDVLAGCDYVITSILVGGYDAIEKEIDIPMQYGVSQTIGDTLTPGGIMRCQRTLPHMVGMARDVMELCPQAQILNYTNPMGMLCWGMYTAVPEVKLVGLCHSVQGGVEEWSRRLGIDTSEVNFVCAGINHQAWFLKFERQGEDLLPKVRAFATQPETWLGDTSRMEYLKHFGYPVTESSGHNTEYSPWFRKSAETINQYCPNGAWNGEHGHIKKVYVRSDWREYMEKLANGERPIKLDRSIEYGSQIISAMEGGAQVVINGNVPNDGLIDNMPPRCCVEVPCLVDRNGILPMHVGTLPTHLAAINRTQINVQELAKDAALECSPEKVFQAMCMDPLTAMCCTLDQIRAMTTELLEAHAPYLPGFAGKALEQKPVMIGCKAQEHEQHVDPGEAAQA